jgi:hypothetical protein
MYFCFALGPPRLVGWLESVWWIRLYGKIRNEQWGLACVARPMCTLTHPQCSLASFDTSVSVFAKSPPPHDASRSACPVTAHITLDVEKVSSYFPLPPCTPPLQYSPPKCPPHSRSAPAPNLPHHYYREGDLLIVFVPPQPLAHRVHPPVLPSFPALPPIRYCYSLVLPAACPAVLLTFVLNLISTYAHMLISHNIPLSSFPPCFPSLTLRMQCHISFITSPNYPFVFCNHNFFLSHCMEWDNLAFLFCFSFRVSTIWSFVTPPIFCLGSQNLERNLESSWSFSSDINVGAG